MIEKSTDYTKILPEQNVQLQAWRDWYVYLTQQLTNDPKSYLGRAFPETSDRDALLSQLTELRKCLASFRPFDAGHMRVLSEQFDTEYTYESNRIEGNTLTFLETDFVVNKGMTIGGKPLKDHLEAINHQEAVLEIRELAASETPFTEAALLKLHSIILMRIDRLNAGIYRSINVGIKGSDHVFPPPFIVPELMERYFVWYNEAKDHLHPVQLAAQVHARLVTIHPFADGNGRTARLVMNLILMRAGYPITIIASENTSRSSYYATLKAFNADERAGEFDIFIAQNVKRWSLTYLELFAGNIAKSEQGKGYYFFEKIAPYMRI